MRFLFSRTDCAAKSKGLLDDFVDGAAGGEVGFELRLAPAGFVFLDEVGGGGDFHAGAADELDRAGIHHGDVGNGVFRRILHGHIFGAAEKFFQIAAQLFLRGKVESFAGQRGEGLRFDLVHQFLGRAFCGDEIEPAARAHAVGKGEDAEGDGIAAAEIVEEPAVELRGSEVFLNGFDVCAHKLKSRQWFNGF